MKLKVGMKVRINEDLSSKKQYTGCCACNIQMEQYKGQVATIIKVPIYDNEIVELDIDNGDWMWDISMFEIIEKKKTFPRMMLVSDTGIEGTWKLEEVSAYAKKQKYPWICKFPNALAWQYVGCKFAKEFLGSIAQIKELKAKVAELNKKIDNLEKN